jgi:hypothetical protein
MGVEDREQQTVFEWASLMSCKYPELEYMYSVPNGGYRNKATAAILKLTGVKSGVPDIFLPVGCNGYHGLYIEMKVGKNKPTDNQKRFMAYLNSAGYLAVVCYGADEAIGTVSRYLRIKEI